MPSDQRSSHHAVPRPTIFAVALASIMLLAAGCQPADGGIEVNHAYAPETPPGSSVGAVYMSIESEALDTLLGATSPVAQSVEMHVTAHEGGMMRMRPAASLAVQPDDALVFKPGGTHFMLLGLTAPLVADSTFPMTLRFEKAGEIQVAIQVAALDAQHEHH